MIDVLLVDDESYVVESLQQTISWQELGVNHVYKAFSAQEALQLLEEQPIDIVVTDIRMPMMSGLELIESINQKWEHIKCILLTGFADFEYAKKAIQLQAFDYLLKPVDDEEFIDTISNAIEAVREEWILTEGLQNLHTASRTELPVLGASLMHDLLLGRSLTGKTLSERLNNYKIPIQINDSSVMMLIKIGDGFQEFEDDPSSPILEYAIGNIAEEVFGDHFNFWYGKGPHDYIVILAALKDDIYSELERGANFEQERKKRLVAKALLLKSNVSDFLQGEITILLTNWFGFPDELSSIYRAGLSAFFQGAHEKEKGIVFLGEKSIGNPAIKSIESLYKPPTLIHLLESSQWEEAEKKIHDIFTELHGSHLNNEHVYEVFLAVSNAFVFLAHKQGQYLSGIDHTIIDVLVGKRSFYTLDKLKEWVYPTFQKLKQELDLGQRNTKTSIVHKVQKFVSENLSQDVSVKTIADRVYLHPVYLSKIYKAETGESLGDYIIRTKMERAAFLLKNSHQKIYEITTQLGYQNPQYFSKMFKKVYGLTPHEFREG